jgi:hypothetical protein
VSVIGVAVARRLANRRGFDGKIACRWYKSPSVDRQKSLDRQACRLSGRLAFGCVAHLTAIATAFQFHGILPMSLRISKSAFSQPLLASPLVTASIVKTRLDALDRARLGAAARRLVHG